MSRGVAAGEYNCQCGAAAPGLPLDCSRAQHEAALHAALRAVNLQQRVRDREAN
jgi:hypothetical protein